MLLLSQGDGNFNDYPLLGTTLPPALPTTVVENKTKGYMAAKVFTDIKNSYKNVSKPYQSLQC